MNQNLKEQMDWYASQPVSYRRMWWKWATEQPNYHEMHQVALATEKDESVLRIMRVIDEQVRDGRKVKV
jgi:hypothetical protein